MPVTFYPSVVILQGGNRNRVSHGYASSGDTLFRDTRSLHY